MTTTTLGQNGERKMENEKGRTQGACLPPLLWSFCTFKHTSCIGANSPASMKVLVRLPEISEIQLFVLHVASPVCLTCTINVGLNILDNQARPGGPKTMDSAAVLRVLGKFSI